MSLPRSGVIFLLAALAAVPARAGDAAALKASAGLGGFCRPGRWTPVRVEIDYRGAEAAGEIAVAWGDALVRRAVSLTSHSRKQFEMYIRTPDARDSMTVRLLADGHEIAAVDTAVRLVAPADPLTVCIAGAAGSRPAGAACTATVNSNSLPHSWRGWGAADDVVLPSDGTSTLTADQQTALGQWRAVQTLENAETASPSIGEVAPPRHAHQRTGAVMFLYAAALGVFVLPFSSIRRRSLAVYPIAVVLAGAGAAVTVASGRIGPGASVHVAQAAVVQQLPGAKGSLVLARGISEFPSFGAIEMRGVRADGAIALRSGQNPRNLRFDENGAPLVAATYGLGSTATFEIEAVTPFEAFETASHDDVVRVSNISQHRLQDCRFGAGFSQSAVGSLAPGQHVEATRQAGAGEELFTCRLDAPVVAFAESHLPVVSSGSAMIVLRLPERRQRP